jgi:hypothetical protein
MTEFYKCIICNYITKDTSNLKRHNKTKKHLKNICTKNDNNIDTPQCTINAPQCTDNLSKINKKPNNKFICNYCNASFTRSNSLSRHKNICSEKQLYEKDNQHEIELLNCKLDKYKHFEEEAKYYKKLLMEAGGLVKKSVSALTYSITNYDDAPPIKTIEVTNVDKFNDSDAQIADDIISACKHKTLNKYLGDIIVKEYKKKKPVDQSIWNTDDTRLTYIIKELIQNNFSNWVVDKKGIKTTIYLIDPLLKHVKSLIITYQKNMIIGNTAFEMEVHMENSKVITDLVVDIDNDVTSKEILKYISSYLRFNETKLKQIT